jgi:histidinol phosphatase-like enzyme
LIIVANQDGIKNVNRGGKKFQYTSGSLEHTCEKDEKINEVLECQGIREHICELLEGGNKAFKLRERKYSLPEIIEETEP